MMSLSPSLPLWTSGVNWKIKGNGSTRSTKNKSERK